MLRFFRVPLIAVAIWAALVYGLPAARGALPRLCTSRDLASGVCREDVQRVLASVDEWAQRRLKPLPRHPRIQRAVAEARGAVGRVEQLARTQVGDGRVDQVVRGAHAALARAEGLVGGTGAIRGKLTQVPENVNVLLGRLRDAFDRLHRVLSSAGRRAEEVSEAVEETKGALDALSRALPSAGLVPEDPAAVESAGERSE